MRADELDYLTEKLKDLFGRRSISTMLARERYNNEGLDSDDLQRVYDVCYDTKMTEPYESELKRGEVEYVNNFRYLEFLRDEEKKPIILEEDNNKYIMAIGKNTRETIQPDWAELYVFNVNGKDDQKILSLCDNLERFMVALLAERFKIPNNWKSKIIIGLDNLKIRLWGQIEDEKQIEDAMGVYAGEVYTAMSCVGYTNFTMVESEIVDYINKVIVQSNRAITDKNIYFKINNNYIIKNLIFELSKSRSNDLNSKLNLLNENLKKFKVADHFSELSDHKRPLYLLNAFEDGFNCELFVSLALYLITCNRSLFPEITEAEICCLPPEFLKEHGIYVADPHMILIFNTVRQSYIFDATGVINLTESKKIELIESIDKYELSKKYKILNIEGEVAELTQLHDELISEFNVTSDYCIISNLEYVQSVRGLENYIGGLVAVVEKKVDAGLPYESLMDTIRRLLILLSRNPGIDKILILKGRSDDDTTVKQLFYSLLNNLKEIPSEKWDRIYLWLRLSDYGIEREILDEILSKILLVYSINYEELNFKELESILARDVSQVTKLKIPNRSRSFELYPNRDIILECKNATEFDKVNDLFHFAENNLIRFGEIGKDRDDLERIQLKCEFSVKITDYSDLNNFMELRGIKNAHELYKIYVCSGGIFANRIHGAEEYERYEHFLMELSDAIKNERLCYSNILSLIIKKEDGRYNKTQIGWENITPYLSKDGTNSITISFTHTLRSVDLYDGFPFNIFFCIELSKEIKDECEKRAGIPIKLKEINLIVRHLHAYLDSIPFKIIEMKRL